MSPCLPGRPRTTRRAAFLTHRGWPMRSRTTWAWMAAGGCSTSVAARGPWRGASRRSSRPSSAWTLIPGCWPRRHGSPLLRASCRRPGCGPWPRRFRRDWGSSGSLRSGLPFTGWTGRGWHARYARCSRRAAPLSRWTRPVTGLTLSGGSGHQEHLPWRGGRRLPGGWFPARANCRRPGRPGGRAQRRPGRRGALLELGDRASPLRGSGRRVRARPPFTARRRVGGGPVLGAAAGQHPAHLAARLSYTRGIWTGR